MSKALERGIVMVLLNEKLFQGCNLHKLKKEHVEPRPLSTSKLEFAKVELKETDGNLLDDHWQVELVARQAQTPPT